MSDVDPRAVDWDDPKQCPWCRATIEDGGAGFVAHIEENPDCAAAFEEWRNNVVEDVGAEWIAD